jgi:hypothetical protein
MRFYARFLSVAGFTAVMLTAGVMPGYSRPADPAGMATIAMSDTEQTDPAPQRAA